MSGPSSNFPAFLQARASNTYANPNRLPQHHHHHLRQFRPSIRSMANQQDAEIFGFETPDVAYGNETFVNAHDNELYGADASMATGRIQTFEDMSRNNPSAVSALTNVSQWQEMQQASQGRLPFRPLVPIAAGTSIENVTTANFRSDNTSQSGSFDSTNTSFGGTTSSTSSILDSGHSSFAGADSMQPLKIDTSVAVSNPSMGILSTPVDATQYEIVHDGEWMWSSTDYTSSSHSSIRTESTGPRTPLSPHTAPSSQNSYFHAGYRNSPSICVISKVEGTGEDMTSSVFPPPYVLDCQCPNCNIPVAPHQLSRSWSASQSQASVPGSFPTYSSSYPSTIGISSIGLQSTTPGAYVPRQNSLPATGSLVDLERQSSETTPEESGDAESDAEEPNVNDQAINDATHRQKRDSFLLSMRRQNYSYKDIKELGNFREAESTLRGRVRVLTKDKSERVRKPEWDRNDISLLYRAFERYACFDDDGEGKSRRREYPTRIPWKKISGWMKSHGSSYPFAPATCARKWKALREGSQS